MFFLELDDVSHLKVFYLLLTHKVKSLLPNHKWTELPGPWPGPSGF